MGIKKGVLAQMGKTPLLDRSEEAAVSKRLGANERRLRSLLLASGLAKGTLRVRARGRLSGVERRRLRELIDKVHAQCVAVRKGRRGARPAIGKRRLLVLDARVRELDERICEDRNRLVRANLRLVIAVAKRHALPGFELSDLIQEGGIGLIRMAEKFDPAKGCRFSTYAVWWIRQAINRAVADQSRTIRVPVHVVELMTRMARYARDFRREHDRDPSIGEFSRKLRVSKGKILSALRAMIRPVSLDSPLPDDEVHDLADMLEDTSEAGPWETVTAVLRREEVDKILGELPPREAQILRLRFGLDDARSSGRTLREVGRHFGISRERIRQIEAEAIARLREPAYADRLRDYYYTA